MEIGYVSAEGIDTGEKSEERVENKVRKIGLDDRAEFERKTPRSGMFCLVEGTLKR